MTDRCPKCSRRLRQVLVEVDAGDGRRVPEEDFTYRECRCGWVSRAVPVDRQLRLEV